MNLYKKAAVIHEGMDFDSFQSTTLDDLKAALADHGLVAVPANPTDVMLQAGHQEIDWCRSDQDTSQYDHVTQNMWGGTNCKQDVDDAYRAMIKAAQEDK